MSMGLGVGTARHLALWDTWHEGGSPSRVPWQRFLLVGILWPLVALAACGTTAQVPNPAASTLKIDVSVFDHENTNRTPSGTTLLNITLLGPPPRGSLLNETVEGADAQTLVCDGVTMQLVQTIGVSSPIQLEQGSYEGNVPPQSGAYTCTYFWNQGAQQATLTIPVVIPNRPHIQSPASRNTVQVPTPGAGGVALSYTPAGNTGAGVTAIASDYNKRDVSSGQQGDSGSVVITSRQFPQAFSVGWGTLSLIRSVGETDLSTVGTNSAFASVHLTQFEQVDQIPVFWI